MSSIIKLGIKKIEYIPIALVKPMVHIRQNAKLSVGDYILGQFTELPTTHLTGVLEENTTESENGILMTSSVSAIIRLKKFDNIEVLSRLSRSKIIYRITTMNNIVYIMGSTEFRAVFSYKNVENSTLSEFQISVNHSSSHGLILDSQSF